MCVNRLRINHLRHITEPAAAFIRPSFIYGALCLSVATAVPERLGAQAAEVQLTPARLTLEAGRRQALYAAVYDRQGKLIPRPELSFTSSDSTVATVDARGTVTGVGDGVATIEARSGDRRATVSVTVGTGTPRVALGSLTIEPRAVALLPLEPARLIARATGRDGAPISVATIGWRSLDPRIAAVDRDGMIVGVAPGNTTISATAGGLTASASVSVDTAIFTTVAGRSLAVGATDTLFASVPSQGGRRLRAGLTWRTSDSAVVRVGSAGDIHGVGPGNAEIEVKGFGMTGRVRVLVHRPVQSFTLSPRASAGPVRVTLGVPRRFEVRAAAVDSTPIPELAVTWQLADSSIATFAPATATLSPLRAGSTTLTARVAGFEPIVWTIEVVPGAISLERARLGLLPRQRESLAIRFAEASSSPAGAPVPVTWTSSRPEVAVVRDGVVEAIAPGRAKITAATQWGTEATADVFVGEELVAVSSRGGMPGIYWVKPAASPSLVPLLVDRNSNMQPALSPDRTRIAFVSDRGGSLDVFVMDADGASITRVTSGAGSETEPAWTPDGARLVYTLDAGAGTQIASVAADGTDARILTATPGGNLSPSVSPDGRTIAFASARDGNSEIYQMAIDGSSPRRLTTTREREQLPRFFPNGDLLYAADRSRGGSAVVRHGATVAPILEMPDAVTSLALSRDGSRMAYIAGRLVERAGTRAEYRLVIQRPAADPAAVTLRSMPGEQLSAPSF